MSTKIGCAVSRKDFMIAGSAFALGGCRLLSSRSPNSRLAHAAVGTANMAWKDMELTTEVARARRIRILKNGPDFFDIPLSAFSIGNSVAFGGFPGEPFNDIGKAVKKGSPFKLTILSCLTNGSVGYFPFSDSFKEDGYEAATSPFGPSVADDLIGGSCELLKTLFYGS